MGRRGVIGLAFIATIILGVALTVVLLEIEVSLRWKAAAITPPANIAVSHNADKGGGGGQGHGADVGGGEGAGGGAAEGGGGGGGAKRAYTVGLCLQERGQKGEKIAPVLLCPQNEK